MNERSRESRLAVARGCDTDGVLLLSDARMVLFSPVEDAFVILVVPLLRGFPPPPSWPSCPPPCRSVVRAPPPACVAEEPRLRSAITLL